MAHMTYLVGLGSGLALASLSAITPQPQSPGIIASETHYGLTSEAHILAPHCPLLFNGLANSTVLAALLDRLAR